MRHSIFSFTLALAAVTCAAQDKLILVDFDTDANKTFERPPNVTIVAENARSGRALKISHPPHSPGSESYEGISLSDPAHLNPIRERFKEFPLLCMDIFNPQNFPVSYGIAVSDAKTKDYGTRYNNEGFFAPPGWSTFRLNITGLTRSNTSGVGAGDSLDMKTLRVVNVSTFDHKQPKPVVLYLSNIRLEGTGLPRVEGLMAFSFGPAKSPVFPGFQGIHENSHYDVAHGFGWRNPGSHRRAGPPDDLGGNYGSGDAFLVDLKFGAGQYVVEMCIDRFDDWGQPQRFTRRTVMLNNNTVHDERLDGETFLKTRYLRFENDEDTPNLDIWDSRVKPLLPIQTFEATVGADGKLEVKVVNVGGVPGSISFLVVYPKAKETEGKAYMAALDKRRKQMYSDTYVLTLPEPDNERPTPTAEEQGRGYITFTRSIDRDIACHSAPTAQERGAQINVGACPGQRVASQLGVLPLKKIEGVRMSASDLAGPGNAKIPASSIELRKVRNMGRKHGYSYQFVLEPCLLQPFDTLTLDPGLTRGVWMTLKVPIGAVPGEYAGAMKIEAEGRTYAVPLNLTVYPFALEKADDMSISAMNTTPGYWGGWYSDSNERWWTAADAAFRDLAEHGFNAVSGGPGMKLERIKDGKAIIDFSAADRWMALAAKHGLTMPGDSYQGMDVFAHSNDKNCMASNEQNARDQYNIGFGELIKIVYGAVEAHAKEMGWPQRSYYLIDEPRPEWGNIEACRQLIELHVKCAPGTRFSGFHGGGSDGRDEFFKLLPVSIAHNTEAGLRVCKEAGHEAWTYSGVNGRWLFAGRQKGLSGAMTAYQFVCAHPYFDGSGNEGAWGNVFPNANGVTDTVNWERIAEHLDDYRYLKTLKSQIEAAKKEGKRMPEAAAAEAFLSETLKPIAFDNPASAALKPDEWIAFRAALVKHIAALSAK